MAETLEFCLLRPIEWVRKEHRFPRLRRILFLPRYHWAIDNKRDTYRIAILRETLIPNGGVLHVHTADGSVVIIRAPTAV